VCVGTNCFVKGSQEILKQLVDFVSENQLTERVSFGEQHEAIDIKATFCFEKCESAPVVSINGRKIEKASFELAKEALLMELENYSIPVAGEC
jgi:NADH:ubiquinone oxidoreductase subunit E